MIVNRLLNDC